MGNSSKTTVKVGFEVIESDENSAVFKRVLPAKGRSKKEIKEHELSLPTATMHFFSYEDFLRLKEIERTIVEQLTHQKEGKSLLKKISNFFEI